MLVPRPKSILRTKEVVNSFTYLRVMTMKMEQQPDGILVSLGRAVARESQRQRPECPRKEGQ